MSGQNPISLVCSQLKPHSSQLVSRFFLDLNIQALDFLIEGREGNVETFSGLSLVPAALFEHVHDYVPLAVFHNVKQGSIGTAFYQGKGRPPSDDVIRQ